ncbi:MAG: class II aldolase/adducin family protein [Spirochaetota bacterium]|nr:class II aldolase/adducin family protein [Spirochaetota bacterium]
MINEREARRQIVEVGKWLYNKGLVAATDGNLSIRLGDRIITTPSGVSKGFLKENELVIVNSKGEKVGGSGKPSTEVKMHLAVYKIRPDVNAVLHAHPPKSIAFTIAGVSLTQCVIPEVVVTIGAIQTTPYATPSTDEVVQSINEPIKHTDVLMLDRHGSLTVGKDIYSAYMKLEKLEHAAEILIYARLLGNVKTLNKAEVDKLMELRESTYGLSNNILRCDSNQLASGSCSLNNSSSIGSSDISNEELSKIITQKVIEQLKNDTA